MDETTRDEWRWVGRWSFVFALNLPVPALAAFLLLAVAREGDGRAGMVAGAWVVWAGGVLAGTLWPKLRSPVLFGGVTVALSQLAPVLQTLAGAAGLYLGAVALKQVGADLRRPASLDSLTFLATVLTGQLLLGAALAIGWLSPGPAPGDPKS